MKKNLIIAFLLGMLVMEYAHALKVPSIELPDSVAPELREIIENYVIPVINNGRYVVNVSGTEILTNTELDEGEFLMDDSGVTKYLVVSNGNQNYRVQLTAI